MTLRTLNLRTPLRLLAAVALLASPGCSGCSDDAAEPAEVVAPAPIVAESEEEEEIDEDDIEVGDADRVSDALPEGFVEVTEIPERVREDLVLYDNAKVLQIADDKTMGVLVVSVTEDDRDQVMSKLSSALQEKSYQVEPFTGLPEGRSMLVATKGNRSLSYYIETDAEGRTRIELADLPLEQ